MKRRNHLTDHEIAQYVATSFGAETDTEDCESHIANCERCRWRVFESERGALGVLQNSLGGVKRTPECPPEETLEKFAIGGCTVDSSQRILQHVTDCGYCAPMLKAYLAATVEPIHKSLRQRIISFVQSLREVPLWPKMASAGGVAVVLLMAWLGPVLINFYDLQKANSFAAAFAGAKPPNEMRTTWVPYPKMGFQTMAGPRPSPADDPNLASANQLAAEKLNSTDPRWIRLRGRVKLLLGEDDDAVRLLAAATEKGLTDPATQIDLATAYFQRDMDNQGADNKSPLNLSESLELLVKVLRQPNLDQQEKAIATFDLAVVYEKMQSWGQAVLTWNKYLDLDAAGSWHDEAVRRLQRAKEKASVKPQGYRKPVFFLRHLQDAELQQSLEEYQDIALREWLINAATDRESDDAKAVRILAQLLYDRHGDSWMIDFLNSLSPGDLHALQLLSDAITSNKRGQYTAAETNARKAALALSQDGNYPGALRARFEAVYAQQRLDRGACLGEAKILEKDNPDRYTWLQIQIALEQAVCLNFGGEVTESQEQIDRALRAATALKFHILTLRVYALHASIEATNNNCDTTWREVQAGLDLYWQGPASAQRLYEFLSPIKQCFEKRRFWHAAEILEEHLINILEHEIAQDDKNVTLEVTAHRALAQILRELGDYEAAKDQERIAILLLPGVDPPTALLYEVPIKLELADLELDQGNVESAVARVQQAREVVGFDTHLFDLAFFRIQGDIHQARQQWIEAGEDYKRGIEIAEKRMHQLVEEDKRRQWSEEAGDVYRGLVEVFLQQNMNEEALRLWEWYQDRPFQQDPHSDKAAFTPGWPEIEQTILTRPLPATSVTRLVYASTRNHLHIWTIGSAGISTVSIAEKREDLRQKIRQYIEKCSMRQDPELRVPAPDLEGQALFSQLLQPVIGNLHPSETVVIDLDTGMSRLPLEALKSPEGWYFGAKFPVIYSPGYLRENDLRPVPRQTPRSGLLLYALGPAEREGFSGVFPEIRSADGADLTQADLTSYLQSSEIFVFVGHGDESGGLIFRKGSPSLKGNNFPPQSLRNMQLAVLAGCSTGVATDDFLDTSNLVRAFHRGRTPSVVASRWVVNMEATSALMTSFYVHFAEGKSAAYALYEARKDTMHKYPHPYYWAGFVLSGRA